MYINLSWFVRGFSQMVVYKMSGFEKKMLGYHPDRPDEIAMPNQEVDCNWDI